MAKYWTFYGSIQTIIIGAIFSFGSIFQTKIYNAVEKMIGYDEELFAWFQVFFGLANFLLAVLGPSFLLRSVLKSAVRQKTNVQIGLFDFPYWKLFLITILGYVVQLIMSGSFITSTLINRIIAPVIIAFFMIYPDKIKDRKSIQETVKKSLGFIFRNNYGASILGTVFVCDMIGRLCWMLAFPKNISVLFVIPMLYFTILSQVYLMAKIVEHEEKENSLSLESVK